MLHEEIIVAGRVLRVRNAWRDETYEFSSVEEAQARAAFVREALTWIGTPFVDCGDVKGPKGAVDCAMLLTRASVDSGLLPPFEPRPYSPRHMQNSSEQKFLGWLRDKLGAHEVEAPRFGDVIVWQFGRCFSHGAVLINHEEVVHAYGPAGMCLVSRLDEPLLSYWPVTGPAAHRPVKYFSVWRG